MTRTMAKTGVALTALLMALPLGAQERFTVEGDRVAIYNLAGEFEVVRGSGSDVVVTVTRGGSDASQLRVAVDRIQGRNALRVIYPGDQIVYDRPGSGRFNSSVRVRADGTFGGGWGDRGETVRVSSGGNGLEAWANVRIEIPSGRDVEVRGAVGGMTVRNVEATLLLDTGSGTIDVRDVTGDLSVDTGSGSVEAVNVRGEVSIDTGSGSVQLDGIVGRSVLVDTGSGRVTAGSIEADEVSIDTGSGGVTLGRVDTRELLVDTGSGSVEAELTGAIENIEIDTGSGGVTLRLPSGLNAEIEADTGSGGIDVDFPVTVERMSRDYFRGIAGEGRGRILIDTGSGRIRLLGG